MRHHNIFSEATAHTIAGIVFDRHDRSEGYPRWTAPKAVVVPALIEAMRPWFGHTIESEPQIDLIQVAVETAAEPYLIHQPTEAELRVILGCAP